MQPSRRFRSEKFGRALLFSQQPEHKRQTWGAKGSKKRGRERKHYRIRKGENRNFTNGKEQHTCTQDIIVTNTPG